MRYQIVTTDGIVVEVTNSFSQAVAYARDNKWSIYDTTARHLIYDGYRDELFI